jgi:IS5 family transposase
MRFLGLGLSDRVPDARTIWLFREKLTRAGAIQTLFDRFDAMLRAAGYIAMSDQIVDASLVAAPRQRNTNEEKQAIKDGCVPEDWQQNPAKLRHKDREARWTVKLTKAKPREDGTVAPVDIAIPVFGYQNQVSIDRAHGFIHKWTATDAAAYEGARLREGLLDKTNTAGDVWADAAYRSATNEAYMEKNGFVSRVHRKKPCLPTDQGAQPIALSNPDPNCVDRTVQFRFFIAGRNSSGDVDSAEEIFNTAVLQGAVRLFLVSAKNSRLAGRQRLPGRLQRT